MVDDGDAVAEFVGLFHVVRGQNDGNSLFTQAANGVPHGDATLRIEPGARLVEEEDLGTVGDGTGDLDTLGEAARELRRVGMSAFGKVKLAQELVRTFFGLRAGEAEVKAVEVDVLEDGAGAVERVVLRDNADGSSRDCGSLHDVDSGDADATRSWQGAGGADADGSGFAGSVGAEKAEQLTLANAEIDTVDGDDPLLAVIHLLKAFNLNNHCGFTPVAQLRLYAPQLEPLSAKSLTIRTAEKNCEIYCRGMFNSAARRESRSCRSAKRIPCERRPGQLGQS